MATTLDLYYQNKQQLNARISENKLTMDQLLGYQELLYRISILESCMNFVKTAPVTADVSAMSYHYKIVDALFTCLLQERQFGIPADEKLKKQRATALSNLQAVITSFRNHVMEIHYTLFGGKEQAGADLTRYGTSRNAGVTRTGYYLGKFVNEKQPIDTDDTYGSSQNYIIWRYAEALLDYAEVVFRLGDTETALAKVNEIRRRVHMDALTSLDWESLVNERRVELAFEESTYWDLLRWGIAEERMNGSSNPLKAMKIVREEGKPDVYTVSNMNAKPEAVRVFKPMQYYWPIPWDEVRYQNIEQNPEWVEL